MPILAQQQGLVGHRQINEFLVIGVAASKAGFRGHFNQAGVAVEGCEHVFGSELVKVQAWNDFWIGQHARQFVAHGLGGQPVQLARLQCLPDR